MLKLVLMLLFLKLFQTKLRLRYVWKVELYIVMQIKVVRNIIDIEVAMQLILS